jgi:hypothetical protein
VRAPERRAFFCARVFSAGAFSSGGFSSDIERNSAGGASSAGFCFVGQSFAISRKIFASRDFAAEFR